MIRKTDTGAGIQLSVFGQHSRDVITQTSVWRVVPSDNARDWKYPSTDYSFTPTEKLYERNYPGFDTGSAKKKPSDLEIELVKEAFWKMPEATFVAVVFNRPDYTVKTSEHATRTYERAAFERKYGRVAGTAGNLCPIRWR